MTRSAAASSALELIGNTPAVHLARYAAGFHVVAKLEVFAPGGSVKDRIGLYMVEEAERTGRLRPGMVVVEPTAGNTGIGVAIAATLKGYRAVLVMPDSFSREKAALMRGVGGEVVHTPGSQGMEGAMAAARQIAADRGGIVLSQFTNPDNVACHERTTGPELWSQMEGRVDALVLGGGSFGTFTGVARCFRARDPGVRCVLVQPQGSFLAGPSGRHKVEGIGADSEATTALLDRSLVDEIVMVSDRDAHAAILEVGLTEGLLIGGSAGAAAHAARETARKLGPGARVATLFPDAAERYLSQRILGTFEEWER